LPQTETPFPSNFDPLTRSRFPLYSLHFFGRDLNLSSSRIVCPSDFSCG
jgi:hypothetical protein